MLDIPSVNDGSDAPENPESGGDEWQRRWNDNSKVCEILAETHLVQE